uniref:Uncharacterized protein n=1 Tax=Meloidogyne incognita TaxID=6306 RepID=A0A914N1K6_MELIC
MFPILSNSILISWNVEIITLPCGLIIQKFTPLHKIIEFTIFIFCMINHSMYFLTKNRTAIVMYLLNGIANNRS